MRPVNRGWIRYESLLDGTIDLFHVAEMNEALDVIDENNARLEKARLKKT